MTLDLLLTGVSWGSDGKGNVYDHKAEDVAANFGNLNALIHDPRFRSVPIAAAAYHDYFAVLAPDEVVVLAAVGNMTKGQVTKLKKQVSKYKFLVAHIYEWETGYDA